MEVKYSFFEYDQSKLYYGIVGEGFPVLLLHGWPQTSFMWRHLYPYLVKYGFNVIMPDLPGLGKSSAPKSFDKKTIASYIQVFVHDFLGFDKIFIIGHDWGGPISFSYAQTCQNKVKKIVLIDVPIPGDGSADFPKIDGIINFIKLSTYLKNLQ